jgi:uncharacterized membrane protein YkoI
MLKLRRKFKNLVHLAVALVLVLALGLLAGCESNIPKGPENGGSINQSDENHQQSDSSSNQPSDNSSESPSNQSQNKSSDPLPDASADSISKEKAKVIALDHAGVNENDASFVKVELDINFGQKYWEVDFRSGNSEYEYEIDAANGKILKSEKEIEGRPANSSSSVSSDNKKNYISKSDAENKALFHAKLSKNQVRRLECELDHDDGRPHYEVEFYFDKYDYDCKVDAFSGEVYDFKKEIDD